MSEIISKDAIRAKARAAHAAGRSRDEHGFNWHAPALATWLLEYDRCSGVTAAGDAHLHCITQTLKHSFQELAGRTS